MESTIQGLGFIGVVFIGIMEKKMESTFHSSGKKQVFSGYTPGN